MPDFPEDHDESPDHERRNIFRRLDHLERRYDQLSSAVQRVEIEQGNAKEVLKSRFDALNRGQDLLLTKIESFATVMQTVTGDPENSPAGKALSRSITHLDECFDLHDLRLKGLEEYRNEVRGGIRMAQAIGLAAIVTALGAIFRTFLFH